jgi:hypothetical protein
MGASSNSFVRTDVCPKCKPQKPRPYKKVINTPTSSIEMTPLKVMNTAKK